VPIEPVVDIWDKAIDFFIVQGPAVAYAMSIAFGSSWWTVKVYSRGIEVGMKLRKDQDIEAVRL
jgi:hypothetical protein